MIVPVFPTGWWALRPARNDGVTLHSDVHFRTFDHF